MGWWSERVVPRLADRSLSSRPIMELSAERLDQAYLPGPGLGKPWTFVSLATAFR